ncbi:hypothetical protein [uncultured Succiniclasticum sp.]|uniref:hypothetical protein n=1 Tax=uncultured Succiniclasticum sp. TaxID=1500547 RepID=UPI0025D04BE6|nr:hypothetical protein [uncultured Succiniclasticum sp.]
MNKAGLAYFYKRIKQKFAPRENGVEFIAGTQATATGAFTGVTAEDKLYDGKTIAYYLPFASSGNATLELSLSGGGTTGPKPVFYTASSRLTTHYGAGSVILLTYLADKDGWYRADHAGTYSNMTAATEDTAGKAGLVPAPGAGKQGSFLRGDGTWQEISEMTETEIDAIFN